MKKRLAIIVPYRDRPNHLRTFVKYMNTYLPENGVDEYGIYVVEQSGEGPFNRGKLLNVGSEIAIKEGYDYLCFHDVDLLPIEVDYSYPDYPTSLVSKVENKEGDILFRYFGGVTAFNTEDFVGINGYSNNYWGWGFEDDDLFHRVTHGGLFFDSEKVGVDNFSNYSIEIMEDGYCRLELDNDFLDNDFTLEITSKVNSSHLDENKEYDEYPIVCIPGYNIGLFYNSFNRFFFQVFDTDKKPYSITTQVLDDVTTSFRITKKGRKVSMFMNDVFVDEVEMENDILNLGGKNLYIGSVSDKETVEFDMNLISLTINGEGCNTTDFVMNKSQISHQEISHMTSIPKPIRREGIFRELYHDNNASIEKNWIHKETRNNQLYYNNIVKQNLSDFTTEGLNSLEYQLINDKDLKGYRKITVQI